MNKSTSVFQCPVRIDKEDYVMEDELGVEGIEEERIMRIVGQLRN